MTAVALLELHDVNTYYGNSPYSGPRDRVFGIDASAGRAAGFPDIDRTGDLNMGAYSLGSDKLTIEANRQRVYDLFPRLAGRKKQLGGTLSGGEQQMLAIGRALMARPKLLMLDEPSLGLAPLLVKAIFETVRAINHQGVTVLLVEQNARAALRLADLGMCWRRA
jgi:branched-chain amino acid transport system ATP-binding protein